MTDEFARTARGHAAAAWRRMEEVYGWEMSDGAGDFFGYTADHLFGDIWNRPGLADRDRRLLLIGMLAAQDRADVLGIQIAGVAQPGRARRRGSCARS